jgi:hypothetical protein
MRRTTKLAILGAATALVGAVSCNGGPGGLIDPGNEGWDYDHGNLSQRERAPDLDDNATNSQLPVDGLPANTKDTPPTNGGGTGATTFTCSGIYECVLTGRVTNCVSSSGGPETCSQGQTVTVRVKIELQEKNGTCFIGEAVLEPNGTLRGDDADEVGTWTRQGNGIYITAGESTGFCYPSSGPVGVVDINGQTPSGSSGSGSGGGAGSSTGSSSDGNGDISIDPGTGEEGSSSSSSGSGG